MPRGEKPPLLSEKLVTEILDHGSLPSAREQAENLILWLGSKCVPGQPVREEAHNTYAIFGAASPTAIQYLIENLIREKLMEQGSMHSDMKLSFDGWKAYEELKRGKSDTRKAFMAMQYGRPALDNVFKEFKLEVKNTGFDLRRLDEVPTAGTIDDRLRVEIRTSRFVVVDLTDNNLGAYWEAGFAEGLGKPVFYSCEKSFFEEKRTHFDANHQFTVLWEANKIKEAAETLKTAIRATLPAEAKMTDD
jgi:hypothetical protein